LSGGSTPQERFSSRWGLLAASLGCAIGVGNIWRFPRIAAENGGGVFIILWMLFLFLWSIPLMVAEYSLGRKTREGVVGSFAKFGGKNRAWMGGFMALVATCVLFYYTVIAGWCFYYFFQTLSGNLSQMAGGGATDFFMAFTGDSIEFVYMAIPLLICSAVIFVGGVTGIERMNTFMIPTLFLLLISAAIYACTLPGAMKGIEYLFVPKWEYFGNYKTWINALAQSAWSTGAGFGLYLTYSVYVSKDEDIVTNTFFTGIGNNIASIFAALAIIPTIFSILPSAEAEAVFSKSSVGLTFFALPELFGKMPYGNIFAPLFFLTLIFAALSSLISLVELPVRVVMDFGYSRQQSVILVALTTLMFGSLSAYSLDFLDNQDFVWGQGLIISGMFLAWLIIGYGAKAFRVELIEEQRAVHMMSNGEKISNLVQIGEKEEVRLGKYDHMSVGGWFDPVVTYIIPVEFIALMSWWAIEATSGEGWWNPIAVKSLGTCLTQWGIAIMILLALNNYLKRKIHTHEEDGITL